MKRGALDMRVSAPWGNFEFQIRDPSSEIDLVERNSGQL